MVIDKNKCMCSFAEALIKIKKYVLNVIVKLKMTVLR